MDPTLLAHELDRIRKRELDDVERAIKSDDKRRALSELDDAMSKLKKLANRIRAEG